MKRQEPQPGRRYRHFSDGLCQITTLAADSQTNERLVVYQTLSGNFDTYVCPLARFMDEIDTARYPDAGQKYVFEEVLGRPGASSAPEIKKSTAVSEKPSTDGIHPHLMDFLDADTDAERYQILSQMAEVIDDHMIDTMAVVSDIVIDDGPVDMRYQELKNCIRTRMRYETNRLR